MPKQYDPNHDYTLDIADEDIKIEGDKKFVYLRGLEKLARDRGLKGTSSRPVVIAAGNNFYGIMCTYTYHFEDGTYEGSADATTESCKGDFGKFLCAIAESRAKARALRAAFNINLCSVEEKGATLEDFQAPQSKIGDHQLMLIDHLAKKCGMQQDDLIKQSLNRTCKDIRDLSKDDGITMIGFLNKAIADSLSKTKGNK